MENKFCAKCGMALFNCTCETPEEVQPIEAVESAIIMKDREKPNLSESPNSKRKATKRLKYHGFEFVEKLSHSEVWEPEIFKEKVTKDESIIAKLNDMGVLTLEVDTNQFLFGEKEKKRFVSQVNLRKIEDSKVVYHEDELLGFDVYSHYLFSLFRFTLRHKARFMEKLISLSYALMKKIRDWEQLSIPLGQILYCIKATEYFKRIESEDLNSSFEGYFTDWKINELRTQISFIKDKIKHYQTFSSHDEYIRLRNHFKKCVNTKCDVCGGNLLNIMMKNIEQVRARIGKGRFIETELKNIKKIAYCNDHKKLLKRYEKIKSITRPFFEDKLEKFVEAKDLEWSKRFNKKQKEGFLATFIKYNFYWLFYRNIENLYRKKDLYFEILSSEDSKDKKRPFISYSIKEFRTSVDILNQLKEPLIYLDSIDSKIIQEISFDQKVFKSYDRIIKKLGRRAEKWIYEGLKNRYKNQGDIQVIWMNENEKGTGTEKPYDILILEGNIKKQFIEVKTTHSNKRSFSMSKREYDFAIENKDRYKLYLIVNMGAGIDTYYEEIDNIAECLESQRLKITSRKFMLN